MVFSEHMLAEEWPWHGLSQVTAAELWHGILSLSLARINIMYRGTGLYKLLHPAILDGKTWITLGEHGEH